MPSTRKRRVYLFNSRPSSSNVLPLQQRQNPRWYFYFERPSPTGTSRRRGKIKLPRKVQFNNTSTLDFRSIRLGDINLISFIGEDDVVEGHVLRREETDHAYPVRVASGKRKIYHARIFGSQDTFTLFSYHGVNFAELGQWKARTEELQFARHPYMFQLFGTIPLKEALSKYQTHLSRTAFNALMNMCRLFVTGKFRVSSGQLCIELEQHNSGSHVFSWITDRAPPCNTHHNPSLWNSIPDLQLLNGVVEIEDILRALCSSRSRSKTTSRFSGHIDLGTLYLVESWTDPLIPMSKFHSFPPDVIGTAAVEARDWSYVDGESEQYLQIYSREDHIADGWISFQGSKFLHCENYKNFQGVARVKPIIFAKAFN
ncbi:hypothetical protein B0H19DRAFT_1062185 [Mycena capillaripes]|nr:hypothetical protein B0H19DRAFT_1062185 [Mycena capillaripes]